MSDATCCPICHRTLAESQVWCAECTTAWNELSTSDHGVRSAEWAAKRAWMFAGAEIYAATRFTETPGTRSNTVRMRRRR